MAESQFIAMTIAGSACGITLGLLGISMALQRIADRLERIADSLEDQED